MKVNSMQPLLSLRPTQFAVGVLEVEYKANKLEKMNHRQRKREVMARPIPIVISPAGELFVTDHHHFLFACFQANVKKVHVVVEADFSKSKFTYSAFWKMMVRKNYAYLYDQFGQGPRNPLYLPLDVRGLADDPYRSLAWIVRKEGGFKNSVESYSEFQWANFFREHKLLDRSGRDGLHAAVKKGIAIVKKKSPKHLPGAIAEHKIESDLDLNKKKKTKYILEETKDGEWATAPSLIKN